MAIDIGQGFLNDTKQGPPHRRWKFIDLVIYPEPDVEARTTGKALYVSPKREAQTLRAQDRRMHQIAEGTQFLHRLLQRRLNVIPKRLLFALQGACRF